MKASKILVAQKALVLKQGDDGVPVAEFCLKAGISQADKALRIYEIALVTA